MLQAPVRKLTACLARGKWVFYIPMYALELIS
jgi:hypothetical protein